LVISPLLSISLLVNLLLDVGNPKQYFTSQLFLSFFFFFQYWGLNSSPTSQATPPTLFREGVFQDRLSQTICPCWLQTVSLLISASWVARISGVSHQHPARLNFWKSRLS
jgi:hypothetical protein